MSPLRAAVVFAFALVALATRPAPATAPRLVRVFAPRIHLSDLVDGVGDGLDVDLGPTPLPPSSIVLARRDIVATLATEHMATPTNLADAYRIQRATRTLGPNEIVRVVNAAARSSDLPRGCTLTSVIASHPEVVVDGWTESRLEVARPPHGVGPFRTVATLRLLRAGNAIAILSVSIELGRGPQAGLADVAHGSAVTLVVARGLVEVSTPATTASDADVGGTLQVILHPSGRTVLARLVAPDRAVAVDGP